MFNFAFDFKWGRGAKKGGAVGAEGRQHATLRHWYNAVIFASFLTGVVLNTLFSASGYRIAIQICKDCVLEKNEAVEKSDNYAKTSRKDVKF